MIYCLALSNMGREFLIMLCADPYGPCCYCSTEGALKEFSHDLQVINNAPKGSAVRGKTLGRLLNINPSIVGFEASEALPEIRQWNQSSIFQSKYEILKGRKTEVLLMKPGFIAGFEQINIVKEALKTSPMFMDDHIAIPADFSWDILTGENTKLFIDR